MKTLSEFIKESLNESNESIKSEKDFREYAEKKFKEVFGDELDEDKMNDTIEGILDDNSELVDDNKWGELVGILNKSFTNEK